MGKITHRHIVDKFYIFVDSPIDHNRFLFTAEFHFVKEEEEETFTYFGFSLYC